MIDRQTLARWSQQPDDAHRYLRPFVARGTVTKGAAVTVGLNPATPVGPADVEFERYLDLLLDFDAFAAFFRDLRVKRGKKPTSPTRRGLDGMARWLCALGVSTDTNVSPYPTASTEETEELDRVPVALQGRHVLREVLEAVAPRLVVLQGEHALRAFVRNHAPELVASLETTFTELVERRPHLGRVTLQAGEQCEVFVCPHLRFFGYSGGRKFAALIGALTAMNAPARIKAR